MGINVKKITAFKIICCFIVTVMLSLIMFIPSAVAADENIIYVTSTAEIHTALKSAQPGDEIVIKSGTYIGKLGSNASGFGSAYFNSDMSGTKEKPITIRSEDTENPATLLGERVGTGYVFRITGDYWIIDGINFSTAQKGIMLDNANYNIIKNCSVDNIGTEGVHFRDNSSYNILKNSSVTNTGIQTAGFGEGVYVGSANSAWNEYGSACNYNTITDCRIGPGVAAEHFDIKEGTTGTVVENCIMDGTGMSGQNYADSFIDLKGNDIIVRNNICYRNNNAVIVDAFQLHNQIESWGNNNEISGNTVYMDEIAGYVINATHDTSAKTCGNTRVPEGDMYTGDVTEYIASDLTVSLTGDNQSPAIGDVVTLTATASRGEGDYLYRLSATNAETGETIVLRDYSAENTFLWTVKNLAPYCFKAEVKDATSFTVSAEWSYTETTVAPIKISSVEKNGNEFTVNTAGGSGKTLYSYYIIKNGKVYYSVVRQNDKTIKATLPTEKGEYKVRIYAEDVLKNSKAVNTFTVKI